MNLLNFYFSMKLRVAFFLPVSVLSVAMLADASSSWAQAASEYRSHVVTVERWPAQAVRAANGMVATDEQLGSRAGVEILKRGGNAIDAAVAVGFALAVVEPAAGNIGGGGFMLVRLADGRTKFLDYREVAPGKATRNMYVGADGKLIPDASTLGFRSVAVPGTVAGLAMALKMYGTMSLADVMAPAIGLAENGFPVSEKLAHEFDEEKSGLSKFSTSSHIFLNDGHMFHVGNTLRQPELAATLKRIAKNGAAEFYSGKTARILVDDMAHNGGIITSEDLARYTPKMRNVLRASYQNDEHSWEVLTSPPPSSGGVAIIEALNMLKDVPLKEWSDVESVHMVAETMRRVFADRAAFLADPDYTQIPVAGLTSRCYAKERVATIDPQHASSSKEVHAGTPHTCDQVAAAAAPARSTAIHDGPHTTHFSVVDKSGNAVSSTYTLNDSYGSHATSSAGFLLNDEMDDFTTQPGTPNALFGLIQSDANAIAPGHRPLSSMSPTMVLRDGQLSFVTGSPGGPMIISATLLSVINWMRLGMDAQAAINAPRFHHQWMPDTLYVEPTFGDSLVRALSERGFMVDRRRHIGLVNAIGIDPKTNERMGAADPRDNGSAAGY